MNPRQALRLPTTAVTPRSAEMVRLPGDRGEVGQALAHLRNTGQLVSATAPTPTGFHGQVLVNVRLVPRPQVHAVRPVVVRRQLSTRAIAAIAAAAVTVLAGLGWLLYALVTAILEHAAVIVGALVLVAVVLVVIGKAGGRTFSGTFRGSMD